MLSIDRRDGGIVQDPEQTDIDSVLHIAVDGTHASAKTTLIERFLYERQLQTPNDYDFGPQVRSRANQTYPFYCVIEQIGELAVPIVVTSEMARQYDAWHLGEKVLTDGYNEHDQAAITFRAFGQIQEAAMCAASFAKTLQADSPHRVSAIITDRTGLSGFSYADTALPDVKHDYLDLALNADIDGLAQSGGGFINLRQQVVELTSYCDIVIVPDHHEVRFEDDDKRKLDTEFRNAIAKAVVRDYASVVGLEKMVLLSGNKNERQQHFERLVREVITHAITQSAG